jgi:D-3-phosphoglycerate dehydrogenase
MKSLQVIRVNISPYQRADFISKEKLVLEKLPGIDYRSLEDFKSDQELVLITNTHTRLAKLPSQLIQRTGLILHPNSGYDHFAEDRSLWEGIPTVIGHEIRAQAVAEYTLGCLFQGMLEIPQHLMWDKNRNWERPLLKDQKVLVFGYGHIGKIVADTLAQLGMKVTVIDPFVTHCPHKLVKEWSRDLVKEARAILVCSSLNSTSRKLFNNDFFNELNPEALFINGARGPLVDETALKEYLLNNPRAYAFLDVFEEEPFQEEWINFPQVWKTSHIAGVHKDLDQGIIDFEFKVLQDFLSLDAKSFAQSYRHELLQIKWKQGELI